MRAQQSGSIIVTTSVAALKPENFVCTAYLAAKAGAAHLVRQVALELARYNIRVNAMAPGSFLTGIGGGRMADPRCRNDLPPPIRSVGWRSPTIFRGWRCISPRRLRAT